jgi:hypothetical protein
MYPTYIRVVNKAGKESVLENSICELAAPLVELRVAAIEIK